MKTDRQTDGWLFSFIQQTSKHTCPIVSSIATCTYIALQSPMPMFPVPIPYLLYLYLVSSTLVSCTYIVSSTQSGQSLQLMCIQFIYTYLYCLLYSYPYLQPYSLLCLCLLYLPYLLYQYFVSCTYLQSPMLNLVSFTYGSRQYKVNTTQCVITTVIHSSYDILYSKLRLQLAVPWLQYTKLQL